MEIEPEMVHEPAKKRKGPIGDPNMAPSFFHQMDPAQRRLYYALALDVSAQGEFLMYVAREKAKAEAMEAELQQALAHNPRSFQ